MSIGKKELKAGVAELTRAVRYHLKRQEHCRAAGMSNEWDYHTDACIRALDCLIELHQRLRISKAKTP